MDCAQCSGSPNDKKTARCYNNPSHKDVIGKACGKWQDVCTTTTVTYDGRDDLTTVTRYELTHLYTNLYMGQVVVMADMPGVLQIINHSFHNCLGAWAYHNPLWFVSFIFVCSCANVYAVCNRTYVSLTSHQNVVECVYHKVSVYSRAAKRWARLK